MRKAFTMVELVFVIVIIGILAGVAITKINFGVSKAQINKAKSEIQAIRSAIINKGTDQLVSGGGTGYPETLEDNPDKTDRVFEGVLGLNGFKPDSANGWTLETTSFTDSGESGSRYKLTLGNKYARFKYIPARGAFECMTAISSDIGNGKTFCDDLK